MKKMKKILCLCLALAMCLSLVNLTALAADDTHTHDDNCPLCAEGHHEEGDVCDCCGYGDKDKNPDTEELSPQDDPKDCGVGQHQMTLQGNQLVCSVCNTTCGQVDENGRHKTESATKEATCFESGYATVSCITCGTVTETIPALSADYSGQKWESCGDGQHKMTCKNCDGTPDGHSKTESCADTDNDGKCDDCGVELKKDCDHGAGYHEDKGQYKAPTCTEKGQLVYVCDACDGVVANKEIEPLGHEWGGWDTTKEPTCTEPGEMKQDCKRSGCNASETKEIPAKGHVCPDQLVWDDNDHWSACKVCGDVIGEKKSHDWQEVYKKPATCEKNGEIKYDCRTPGCNASKVEVIPATGHAWDYKNGVVIVKPTVNEDGIIRYTCKNDPNHTKDEPLKFSTCDQVDENGKHKAQYLVTKEPTCTEKGAAQWWCPSCETVFENVDVPAKGHQTKIVVVNAPTCTEKGNEHEVCTVCGAIVENKENSALGHDWGDWQSDGQKGHYQVCNRCKSHSETVDHSFGAWETVREATATEEGVERHVCNNCDYTETRNTSVIEGQDPGNQGGNEPTRYTLTINYRYADGTEAAAQYSQEFESNASYNVVSPVIAGYSPDVTQVIGEITGNVTVTVTYSRNVDIDEEDPPLTETPGDRDPIVTDPETDIPDENPPLVDLPDEQPPLVDLPDEETPTVETPTEETPVPVEELPDEQLPLVDLPDEQPPLTDIPMEQPILAEQVEVDISDDPTPLANVPQTGDISLVWYVAAAMSAMGLAVLTLKKREGEKD